MGGGGWGGGHLEAAVSVAMMTLISSPAGGTRASSCSSKGRSACRGITR